MKIVRTSDPAFPGELERLKRRQVSISGHVRKSVAGILADVAARGDAAVFDYTAQFDKERLTPQTLLVPKADLKKAFEKLDRKLRKALKTAAKRIRAYHEHQKRKGYEFTDGDGARLALRIAPVDSVMAYVPGGRAAYPSTLLMTVIPAKVAGVKNVYVCSPGASVDHNPITLAAAHVAGVDAVYRIGGAQAVGAFAYGTQTIPPVDKIVGPGNAYVAEAKRQVFGTVGIDSVAGPSEIVVVADAKTCGPGYLANDLLSQAEHDELATAVLFTPSEKLAGEVSDRAQAIARQSPRREILEKSLETYGRIFIVEKLADAARWVNELAPEHVELCVANARTWVKKIEHAGAIFVGPYTPEAVGDYMAGSNHVLPTGGAARFASPLGVDDYLKKTSIVEFDATALRKLGPEIVALAQAEGLPAHAGSVSERLEGLRPVAKHSGAAAQRTRQAARSVSRKGKGEKPAAKKSVTKKRGGGRR